MSDLEDRRLESIARSSIGSTPLFSSVANGYDPHEVNETIDELIVQIGALTSKLARLRAEVDSPQLAGTGVLPPGLVPIVDLCDEAIEQHPFFGPDATDERSRRWLTR
ncbi:MAG: DivIVA domain-containing protein [Acidimicrobiia bacterium]|nr:DivIVA domain-containing protein [Acidimicrobiia bacterium]